jgi:hypothetical protein
MTTQQGQGRMSGFRFNHVVIVQSLESHETQTGGQMADFIDVEMQSLGLPVSVELIHCESYVEFLRLMSQLEADGERGMRPIVQIECHGDQEEGLEFANSSMLSWNDLSAALSRVNIATRFNLVAIVSACFGAYFSSHMAPIEPAPCYALISPTAEIKPYELRTGLQGFYREFLRSPDVGEAVRQLRQQRLSAGTWFAAAAEQWFEQTLVQYVEERCSRRASIERAAQLNDRWRAAGRPEMSQRKVFEMLRTRHKGIVEEAFGTFFSLASLPENASRFADCYASAKLKVDRIRARGTHIL